MMMTELIIVLVVFVITSLCDDIMETLKDKPGRHIFAGWEWFSRDWLGRYEELLFTTYDSQLKHKVGDVVKMYPDKRNYTIVEIPTRNHILLRRSKRFLGIPVAGGHVLSGVVQAFWDGWHFMKTIKIWTYAAGFGYLIGYTLWWHMVLFVAVYWLVQGLLHYIVYEHLLVP